MEATRYFTVSKGHLTLQISLDVKKVSVECMGKNGSVTDKLIANLEHLLLRGLLLCCSENAYTDILLHFGNNGWLIKQLD